MEILNLDQRRSKFLYNQFFYMKNIEDTLITAPEMIQPVYMHQDGRFVFKLPLNSQYPHPMHFYIASSLGCCLVETTHVSKIESKGSIDLEFQVKPTNLVGGGIEYLSILASKDKIIEKLPLDNCIRKNIRLMFNNDTEMDPTILQILETEVDNCLLLAEDSRTKGNLNQALNKCQQAYQINRFSIKAFEAMTSYRFLFKDYAGAIRDIMAILLVHPDNPHLKLKKLQLIVQWQKDQISQNEELFYYVKTSLDYFTENKIFMNLDQLNVVEGLVEQFKKHTQKTKPLKQNKFYDYFSEKTLDKFDKGLPIAKYFKTKDQLKDQLKDLFLNQKEDNNATPEEVIDPISYQIIKKPHILPSGTSYQQESLKIYFMTNGYKDPITRQQTSPNYILPNHTFERYIRDHPRLKKWEMYEHDLINN